LTIDGGTGVDGQAALVWIDPIEAGGTLLLEAVGVVLSPGSTGTMAGVYSGVVQSADCVAGFQVTSAAGTGAVSVAPLVQGVVAGPSYTLAAGTQYTLRMRLQCPEVERLAQWYRVAGDAGLVGYGGGGWRRWARCRWRWSRLWMEWQGRRWRSMTAAWASAGYLPGGRGKQREPDWDDSQLLSEGAGDGVGLEHRAGREFFEWQTRTGGTLADASDAI
jgi:hypothetical protein